MSDPQKEEAPRAPIIEHAPGEEAVVPPEHSASGSYAPAIATEEPPPPPPSQPPVAKPEPKVVRRGGTPVLLTLLLCAALGGGIYWTWMHPHETQPQAAPVDPQPAIDAAKADILQKLQALSDRVDKLEKAQAADVQQQAAPPPAPAPAPAANGDALADLSKRLDDLAGHLNAVSEQQAQQSAALQKLQEAPAQPAQPALPAISQPGQPAPAQNAEAQQQLADLGSKLDQALTQEKATLDALAQRLGKVEQDNQAQAQAQTAAADNKTTIEALSAKVQKLEQGEGQIAGAKQDASLAVKLSAAEVALSSGQPLGDLAGAPPALARFAKTPPPTEAGLRAEFPRIAKAALAASRPEETQASFFARALARVEQTVTVRRGDHVIVGDPAAGVIAQAQQDLNEDDLKGAVAVLGTLQGRAAQAVQGWVAKANALLAARAALAQLAHG